MYAIFCSQGQGTTRGPKFHKLVDALRYVSHYAGPGSLAIQRPDGSWYRWAKERAAIKNQRKHSRLTVFLEGELLPGHITVVVRTVSKEGMSVILPSTQEVEQGAELEIRLHLDNGAVALPVQVAWSKESQAGLQLDMFSISSVDEQRWGTWVETAK